MKRAALPRTASPVQLTWSHLGTLYRATAWPDVLLEAHVEGKWRSFDADPTSEVFAAAAVMLTRSDWSRFLEYVPERETALIQRFRVNRLAALTALVRCPELLPELEAVPALASFVANHRLLRGGNQSAWHEIAAIYERSGIFGLLEWLGLPASRDTLDALGRLTDPEIPKRLLERVRELLWNPTAAQHFILSAPATRRDAVAQLEVLAA